MHHCHTVTLEQLLRVRDGGPSDAAVVRHIDRCAHCRTELDRLRAMQTALQKLPLLKAPEYRAPSRQRKHGVRWTRTAGIAASAAAACVVAIVIALSVSHKDSNVANSAVANSAAATGASFGDPQLAALVVRSQALEAHLARLPQRPYVERAGTSVTIDSLQHRIQWVDYQLSYAHRTGVDDRQARRLWQDRIQLLNTLVTVRDAEVQRFAAVQ